MFYVYTDCQIVYISLHSDTSKNYSYCKIFFKHKLKKLYKNNQLVTINIPTLTRHAADSVSDVIGRVVNYRSPAPHAASLWYFCRH